MGIARLHLRFWILLGLLGLALFGGGWWCLKTRRELLLVQGSLAAKRRELQSLRRQTSGIASDTPERISSELAKADETRRSLRSKLGSEAATADGKSEWKLPDTGTEAFLELSEFVGNSRERAQVLGVTVRPDECFGFATYAQTGPEAEYLPAVHRQRVVMRHLLTALLESHPTRILSVQRERPRTSPEATPYAGHGPGAEDYFEMDATRSTATAGIADASAIRLRFTGLTPVLRAFLNRVLQDDLPLVVRSVEAEVEAAPAMEGPESETARLRFSPRPMQFTVTIEHLRLLAEDTPES